jgi:hypothetical protein
MILRPEQRTTVDAGKIILKRYNLLYMACEVRVGKTIMSITIVHELGFKHPCFITKKMALSSVEGDYAKSGLQFSSFKATNFEQVPNLHPVHDVYIIDEAVSCGAYPKPGKYTKDLKQLIGKKPIILMCGSPTPESPSQIFHQFWLSEYSPFSVHKNFYFWAKEYVNVKKKFVHGFQINDYSNANEAKIKEVTKHYMVTLSQEEAGFTSMVEEDILWVPINNQIYQLMDRLKKDKVYKLKSGDHILCDTPVKMQSVFHQLSSGTIKIEEKRIVLDESKAWFIKTKFAGQKIAIFYCFIAEGELLRKHFPMHTDDPELFNKSNQYTFICQVISGRMGINLATADCLVMYNIGFSATSYFQSRARMQSQARKTASKLYWIFSEHGIEKFVYKAVSKKMDFTINYFKKFLKEESEQVTMFENGG